MKKRIFLLAAAIVFSLLPSIHGQTVKGLYVDGFRDILGNTAAEDSLLLYAQRNGFTYLALYDLWPVHVTYDLTNASSCTVMANFNKKARRDFGIRQIGATGENFFFFNNVIHVYNQQHSDTLEKFNVYDVEFEFWNTNTVSPGNYYCTTYLQPGGFSCDTAGAFAYYQILIRQVDSLATADGVMSETYVGWFNQGQAVDIANTVDRILLHDYISNYSALYSYVQPRLEMIAARNMVTDVIPIFSAEPSFLGPWLSTHTTSTPYDDLQTALSNEPGAWKQYIHLAGYQWFAYSFMPYSIPANQENPLTGYPVIVYPNPFGDELKIQSPEASEMEFRLFDLTGREIMRQSLAPGGRVRTEGIAAGVYIYETKQGGKMNSSGKLIRN